jgi:hypothetical protein
MDDRMRVSDADREAVTAKLRDHYAEGRLNSDELDERVTAALHAKTYGDLRALTTDLPGPAGVPPRTMARPSSGGPPPWRHGPPQWRHRHRPPVLLLGLIALLVVLASGGSFVLFGFLRLIVMFWLVLVLVRVVFGLITRLGRRYR